MGSLRRDSQALSPSNQPWLPPCPGVGGPRAVPSAGAEGVVRTVGDVELSASLPPKTGSSPGGQRPRAQPVSSQRPGCLAFSPLSSGRHPGSVSFSLFSGTSPLPGRDATLACTGSPGAAPRPSRSSCLIGQLRSAEPARGSPPPPLAPVPAPETLACGAALARGGKSEFAQSALGPLCRQHPLPGSSLPAPFSHAPGPPVPGGIYVSRTALARLPALDPSEVLPSPLAAPPLPSPFLLLRIALTQWLSYLCFRCWRTRSPAGS